MNQALAIETVHAVFQDLLSTAHDLDTDEAYVLEVVEMLAHCEAALNSTDLEKLRQAIRKFLNLVIQNRLRAGDVDEDRFDKWVSNSYVFLTLI